MLLAALCGRIDFCLSGLKHTVRWIHRELNESSYYQGDADAEARPARNSSARRAAKPAAALEPPTRGPWGWIKQSPPARAQRADDMNSALSDADGARGFSGAVGGGPGVKCQAVGTRGGINPPGWTKSDE